MSAGIRLFGVAALLEAFEDAIKAARQPQEFWVGSAVIYGPFIEWGTRYMAARPHWTTAIRLIQMKYELSVGGDELVNAMLIRPRGLVQLIALDLEGQVKREIRAVGAIDTGNYRASIATGPSESEAWMNSASMASHGVDTS